MRELGETVFKTHAVAVLCEDIFFYHSYSLTQGVSKSILLSRFRLRVAY